MRFLKSLCVTLLVLSSAVAVFAQMTPTGKLTGTVSDQDKAPLPGVSVKISSPSLILPEMATVTNEKGLYHFFSLPSGTYKVVFELQGFKTGVREGIIIRAQSTATLDYHPRAGRSQRIGHGRRAVADRGHGEDPDGLDLHQGPHRDPAPDAGPGVDLQFGPRHVRPDLARQRRPLEQLHRRRRQDAGPGHGRPVPDGPLERHRRGRDRDEQPEGRIRRRQGRPGQRHHQGRRQHLQRRPQSLFPEQRSSNRTTPRAPRSRANSSVSARSTCPDSPWAGPSRRTRSGSSPASTSICPRRTSRDSPPRPIYGGPQPASAPDRAEHLRALRQGDLAAGAEGQDRRLRLLPGVQLGPPRRQPLDRPRRERPGRTARSPSPTSSGPRPSPTTCSSTSRAPGIPSTSTCWPITPWPPSSTRPWTMSIAAAPDPTGGTPGGALQTQRRHDLLHRQYAGHP